MNITRYSFSGIQHKNSVKFMNSNGTINKLESLSASTVSSNISTANYYVNHMPAFKGVVNVETFSGSGFGTLNHQTAFFREPATDEVVQNYILENFGDENEINIISGACSTGEEAKSYAMMLDSLKDKLNIYGFDISSEAVKEAQNCECQLIKQDSCSSDLDSEDMLFDDNICGLTKYQNKCRNKFKEYYVPKNAQYKIPVFPTAKQELEDFMELLQNEEEYKKQRSEYYKQIQAVKNNAPEFAKYMKNATFEEDMEMCKRTLELRTQMYRTVRVFTSDENSFNNCVFTKGDIMNLEQLYKPNSINVLLYRNALYHTLCLGNDMGRYMKDDAQDIMQLIARQMNKILKMQGLVVFGESEYIQGIDTNIIKEVMTSNGFKLLETNGNNNIWVKVKDVND